MPSIPSSQGTSQSKAKLSGPLLEGKTLSTTADTDVIFQFNPKTIKLSHSVNLSEAAAGAGKEVSLNATLDQLGLPSLKLQDTIFDGPATLKNCEQLMAWSNAIADKTGTGKPTCPPLKFSWINFTVQGSKTIAVTMTSVDITYERFTPDGQPIRATVALNLKPEDPSTPGQQNPTSGGLPGRSGHVMISGEHLPGVALDEYGDPGNWRALAEANQLDDPLRVRPGTSLYVPSRAELDGGAVT